MLSYTPNKLIQNVVIFGVGGSGARVASLVCQQLMTEEHSSKTKVILMDGDVVETKNCRRQLFIPSDVGKNKADVIAERYSRAFKSNIISIPSFFPSTEVVTDFFRDISDNPNKYCRSLFGVKEDYRVLFSLTRALACVDSNQFEASQDNMDEYLRIDPSRLYLKMSSGLTVFILAVDSIPARLSILDFITKLATIPNIVVNRASLSLRGPNGDGQGNEYGIHAPYGVSSMAENLLVIDGGNEDSFGQVCYFHPVQFSLCPTEIADLIPERSPYRFHTPVVPMPTGRYLNMKEGVSTRRCGDMDQTLAINNLVATCMHVIFQNLYYNTPMTFNRISFGLNGAFTSEYMGLKWLKGVLTTDKNYLFGTITPGEVVADSIGNIQNMSPVNRIRYGFCGQSINSVPSDDSEKCSVVFGILLGVSIHPSKDDYNNDELGRRFTSINNQSDLLRYLDRGLSDHGSLRPDFSKGEKGLSLLTNTTYLDISWSEILGQIFHKHHQKGMFSQENVSALYDAWGKYSLYGLRAENPYRSLSQLTSDATKYRDFTNLPTLIGFNTGGLRIGYSCVSTHGFIKVDGILGGNLDTVITPKFMNTDTYELTRLGKFHNKADEDQEYGVEEVLSTGMALLVSIIKPLILKDVSRSRSALDYAVMLMNYHSPECVPTATQDSSVDIVGAFNISGTKSYLREVYSDHEPVIGIVDSCGLILTSVEDIVEALTDMSKEPYSLSHKKVRELLTLSEYGIVMYLVLANGRKTMVDKLVAEFGSDYLITIVEKCITLERTDISKLVVECSARVTLGLSDRPIKSLSSWISTYGRSTPVIYVEDPDQDQDDDEDEDYEEDYAEEEYYNDDGN